jgi:hypothetical protein
MRPTRTLTGPLATILAVATLAAPAAASTGQDLRSPDARDVAAGRTIGRAAAPIGQDLRSPDARDVAAGRTIGTAAAPIGQDLRSPDARDAAAGRSTADIAAPVLEVTSAGGFDWGDAAIGAGGATGLLAISLAGAMTLRRRQTRPRSWTAVG